MFYGYDIADRILPFRSYAALPHTQLVHTPIRELLSLDGYVAVWVTNKVKYIEFVRATLFPRWGVEEVAEWHWVKVGQDGMEMGGVYRVWCGLLFDGCQCVAAKREGVSFVFGCGREERRCYVTLPGSL